MSKTPYTPPTFGEKAFNCPHCHVYAAQRFSWSTHATNDEYSIYSSQCYSCGKNCIWIDEKLTIPDIVGVQQANNDLDDDIKTLYDEAGSILHKSPRAAAALLRLALQKLCKQLGAKKNNIHDDIIFLRDNKNLSPEIMKAMDAVRITDNEAVHPGTIDFNDNEKIAEHLFSLINFIADSLITQPKAQEAYYKTLPDGKKIKPNDSNE